MRPRPRIDGKFLAIGDERLWVRGVTYGTFRPDGEGQRFGTRAQVETDFAAMAAQGINAVRTYTAPPPWLLDAALNHGLWVMAGLPWEQHVAFLDDRRRAADIASPDRRPGRGLRPSPRAPLLRGRKRDPDADRAMARPPPGRAVSRAALRRGSQGRPRRAADLRELPEHRVPAAAVRRHALVQRLPERRARRQPLRLASPEPGRRPPAAARGAGRRQPQPRVRRSRRP